MFKSHILIALCLVGIASCTSRRSPRIIYNSANDSLSKSFNTSVFLVAPKCEKGSRYVLPDYTSRYIGEKTTILDIMRDMDDFKPGYCQHNSENCSDYNDVEKNCEKCNFGYKINKDKESGDHCNMVWWMYILIIVGGLAFLALIAVLVLAMCKCCK